MADLRPGDIVRLRENARRVWLRDVSLGDVGWVERIGNYNPNEYGPFAWVQFPLVDVQLVYHVDSLEKVGHVDG